jgi:uncharacterized protein (TIGR02594 family)
MLPTEFSWLHKEPGPKLLRAALSDYGVKEVPGAASNPVILGWAKELGLEKAYTNDGIAWCGLGMGHWVHQAGYQPVAQPLWALNWASWGTPADKPSLGDVLVFRRKLPSGGFAGHVGLYVSETATHFQVLGCNQADQVCVAPVAKTKLVAARRSPWKVAQPSNVRPIRLAAASSVETSQA